jgi:LytS/YehU family sensor histidine kinase
VLEVENEKVQLEKENVATQLLMLRNQVSPHFFMNTLNNIHELIDINAEDAKDAIVRLSTLMRYLLYSENYQLIVADKENEFEVNLTIPL